MSENEVDRTLELLELIPCNSSSNTIESFHKLRNEGCNLNEHYQYSDWLIALVTPLKGKFKIVLKCIYYRAYSMVGIIIHLMCVKSLQLACN